MNTLNGTDIIAIIDVIKDNVVTNRDRLTQLDSSLGDGDLGITMCRGFEAVSATLQEIEEKDIGKILMKAGMVFAQTAPSTMGTLIASGLMKAGKAVSGKEMVTSSDIFDLLEAFTGGIQARGKAVPGDKTILDALTPALETLKKAIEEGKTLNIAISEAYAAAVTGAETTKDMIAKHGRPAYYGDKSVGKKDPGAEVGILILKAFAEYI
ncbi:MAG: dihydroxyacetone kinase subunit L [Candidatus Latescibacteria bacterium]|nr:dihydroxyacetone kinase subunit L [Candidatus Latescibacterota bacterium]